MREPAWLDEEQPHSAALLLELEAALIEYVEKYGLTVRSRAVLVKIGRISSPLRPEET